MSVTPIRSTKEKRKMKLCQEKIKTAKESEVKTKIDEALKKGTVSHLNVYISFLSFVLPVRGSTKPPRERKKRKLILFIVVLPQPISELSQLGTSQEGWNHRGARQKKERATDETTGSHMHPLDHCFTFNGFPFPAGSRELGSSGDQRAATKSIWKEEWKSDRSCPVQTCREANRNIER